MRVDDQRLLDLFLELIKIDSVSLHERAMMDFLIHKFQDWHLQVIEDKAGERIGGDAGNLIVRIPSQSNGASPLLLLAHTDTVRSTAGVRPIIDNGVIRSDGSTILGADNRSGVALVLYVITEIMERNLKHCGLEVVFTVAEELGMLGALALDFSQLQAREGYVFDCSARPGSYVAESPTAYDFRIECHGRASHSAVAPEKGINAISMALEIMSQFPVGRINQQTVANIGTVRGGTADNVVPDQVVFTGEFRSFSPAEIERLKASLSASCSSVERKYGGHCEVAFKLGFEGYKFHSETPVVQRLHRAMRELQLVPNPMVYSGGSDVNVFNANGIAAVNVGIGASNPHSNQEQIALADMVKGVEMVMRLIEAEEA